MLLPVLVGPKSSSPVVDDLGDRNGLGPRERELGAVLVRGACDDPRLAEAKKLILQFAIQITLQIMRRRLM